MGFGYQPPVTGGGGGGVTAHTDVTGKSDADQHPTSAITGLDAALATIPTAYTDEMARDALGTALVAGTNVTITPSDAGDTITIAASAGGSASPYLTILERSNLY